MTSLYKTEGEGVGGGRHSELQSRNIFATSSECAAFSTCKYAAAAVSLGLVKARSALTEYHGQRSNSSRKDNLKVDPIHIKVFRAHRCHAQ